MLLLWCVTPEMPRRQAPRPSNNKKSKAKHPRRIVWPSRTSQAARTVVITEVLVYKACSHTSTSLVQYRGADLSYGITQGFAFEVQRHGQRACRRVGTHQVPWPLARGNRTAERCSLAIPTQGQRERGWRGAQKARVPKTPRGTWYSPPSCSSAHRYCTMRVTTSSRPRLRS